MLLCICFRAILVQFPQKGVGLVYA